MFFEDEVKKLRQSIAESKSYNDAQRTEAYTAIRSLIPDYAGKGNPLDDKKFIEAIKEKYSKSEPDPFKAFLRAAKENLDPKYEPLDLYGVFHPFKYQTSQYEKNVQKNHDLKIKYEVEWSTTLSEKMAKKANRDADSGNELATLAIVPGIPHFLLSTTENSLATTTKGFENIIDIDGGKNPSLEKFAKEIDLRKELLINGLANDPERDKKAAEIVSIHEIIKEYLDTDELHRKVNRKQRELTHFEKQRVNIGEPKDGPSDPNRHDESPNNIINDVKYQLNFHMESILSHNHKYDIKLFFPNGVDFASIVMADIRKENKEKQDIKISGGEAVTLRDVTAQAPVCVIPEEFKHQSR